MDAVFGGPADVSREEANAIGSTAFAEFTRPLLDSPLDERRELAALEPDPGLTRLRALPSLSSIPRCFDGPADSADPTFRFRGGGRRPT